jgi:hypothetical protein
MVRAWPPRDQSGASAVTVITFEVVRHNYGRGHASDVKPSPNCPTVPVAHAARSLDQLITISATESIADPHSTHITDSTHDSTTPAHQRETTTRTNSSQDNPARPRE